MLKLIPWDVWAAAGAAVVIALLALFGPGSTVLIVIYLCLCAYVVAGVISNELVD